jgi:hypothetical protein
MLRDSNTAQQGSLTRYAYIVQPTTNRPMTLETLQSPANVVIGLQLLLIVIVSLGLATGVAKFKFDFNFDHKIYSDKD